VKWTDVKNAAGKRIGRIRRISREPEMWAIAGRPREVFSNSLTAIRLLLEKDGLRFVVKTGLSHRYWTGSRWTNSAAQAQVLPYVKAVEIQESLDVNPKSWDRVVVAVHIRRA
jgi:hypothetical protein